ncbi:histone deacetylase 8 [Schistosoma bovis]|uniref:histone deacetylase n=1 Tax=Schistosoma bovis TaxID=6184 RepID=A0A430QJU0_SCHBO|nr:histone deacetylase 8 [Schistosoma bovis]
MDLINAYKLIPELSRVPPLQWDSPSRMYEAVTTFHSKEYVDALKKLQMLHIEEKELTADDELLMDSFSLNYDCPGFPSVFDYSLAAVQGSLAAANALICRHCEVVINWGGGWHHAKRSEASGFCYLNDAVLAVHRLVSSTPSDISPNRQTRVLYVDLDLHHGDGVEEAFWYSPRVVTFSVHHASPGFFPGTGTWNMVDNDKLPIFLNGAGRGRFSAFNLPLEEGINDLDWSNAIGPILDSLNMVIQPSYVVVQCGADCLATDPHRIFHLTNFYPSFNSDCDPECSLSGYLYAIKKILSWKVPTLVLGGGGYNFPDTARLWTRVTALTIEEVKVLGLFSSANMLSRFREFMNNSLGSSSKT